MNNTAVLQEVFMGGTLVPVNSPTVIYEDAEITCMDRSKDIYRFKAIQLGTMEVIKSMDFEKFFENLSERYRKRLTDKLASNDLPESFYKNVRTTDPGLTFHLLNLLVWFSTVTTHRLRRETFTKMVVTPGIYDTGERFPVDMLVNSTDFQQLRIVHDASIVSTNITG